MNCRDNCPTAGGEAFNGGDDSHGGCGVQTGSGFVEQKQARVNQHLLTDTDSFFLSAGDSPEKWAADHAVAAASETQLGDDSFNGLGFFVGSKGGGKAEEGGEEKGFGDG